MPDIWGQTSEKGRVGQELREEVQLHLARHLGDPHIAFSDNDGWAGRSREPGPSVDVMVVPPEGERRFAYVCTFGSSLKKVAAATDPGLTSFAFASPALATSAPASSGRMEFVLAVPQRGDARADLAMLNIGANTVRQFAKLVHIQKIRVAAGQTVQFSRNPHPILEGSKQVAFAFIAPRLPADGFARLKTAENDAITFWAPIPITREELQAGAHHGPERFNAGLLKAGVTEMLHGERPSAARGAYGLRRPVSHQLRSLFRRD
ncbi:MAG: suppressor of fused domain protein [Hyphomonadaceae bacterium]